MWNGKFGWEYKRKDKHKSLEDAYAQLQRYREALNNPPLLIVSDISRIQIHTNFNNTANETIEITLDDIESGPGLEILRRAFTDPESFRPAKTTEQVTLEVATDIGKIAIRLRDEGHDPQAVAHFLMKCMFCLFAEDVPGLLPSKLFKKLLADNYRNPTRFTALAQELFSKMVTGGNFGLDQIPYFNGGLFNDTPPIKLSIDDLGVLNLAADKHWAHIEPSILGTLFERSLDPDKRAQIGAHYTSKDDILLVIDPVIMQPLRKEWQKLKSSIEAQLTKGAPDGNPGPSPTKTQTSRSGKTKSQISPLTPVHQELAQFLAKLSSLYILDPACGSGNFLYVAIQQLLSLEKEVLAFGAHLPRPYTFDAAPRIRPTQLLGIEINPYAAELAQVSIWIGFLQWLHLNGFPVATDTPILSRIHSIENRDAILDFTPNPTPNNQSRDRKGATIVRSPLATPAQWPDAHFIIGNPPFLGSKVFRANGLPDDFIQALYNAYDLPKTSDLCCYWFELARQKIEQAHAPQAHGFHAVGATGPRKQKARSKSQPANAAENSPPVQNHFPNPFPEISLPRCGLLATQAIRGGDNRTVLQRIKKSGDIFMAWSDKEWVLEGAMVHTSIVGFAHTTEPERTLDGATTNDINADLTSGLNITEAIPLSENVGICFQGPVIVGPFDIENKTARRLLAAPNPDGSSNLDVIAPVVNAKDLSGRPLGWFIVDLGQRDIAHAANYEKPFELIRSIVKPIRDKNADRQRRERWWQHGRAGTDLKNAIRHQRRQIATPRVSKYRLFAWLNAKTVVTDAVVAFARSDDYLFGALCSSVHELWSRRSGTQLREEESGFRYTPSTTFETFPLPWPPGKEPGTPNSVLSPQHSVLHTRIAAAAKELNDLRERWLNPPELIEPLARIIDAQDDFSDVPAEARPLIRHSAIMAAAAQSPNLKKRTLTNLYNERPTWLKLAHEKLDRAVLAAYAAIDPEGHWQEDWATLYTETGAGQPLPPDHPRAADRLATDQKILTNLLRLNHNRAGDNP